MTGFELGPDSRVLVLSGAGVSAESGVPTFRGAGGLWEGHRVEEVASPEGFDADAALVWRFYSQRRRQRREVVPNPGHRALVALERALGDRFLLATQNVDGLHRAAGSQRVVALHGELLESTCERCWQPFADDQLYEDAAALPKCPRCGARIRPHIVWFGESLDHRLLRRVREFMEEGGAGHDLIFLAVGTSGLVYPVAGLVDAARRLGAQTWLVDLAPSDDYAARFEHVLTGPSGVVLPRLFGG